VIVSVVDPVPAGAGRVGVLGGWARTAAATWLLVVGCLAVWSLAPLLVGWRPVVVVTGSMAPRVHPGDVVLIDPGARAAVAPGQVVLIRDPETPTGAKLHRVVRTAPDGTLVTKGDANPTEDTRPVHRSDVEGVARLLVPAAGRISLLRQGAPAPAVLWAGATVLAALALALVPAPARDPAHP